MVDRNSVTILVCALLGMGLGLGVIIGYFSVSTKMGVYDSLVSDADHTVAERIMEEIKPDNIRAYLK